MTNNEMIISTPTDHEIVLTRWFDAPRHLVFEAHSSCEHMKHWWGPRRFAIADCEIDFRTGGKWRIVHRDTDGTEYEFYGEYVEVDPPGRIVWTFSMDEMGTSIETLTLEERDGKTLLTATARYESVEARDGTLGSGMAEGAAETWERLAEYVADLDTTGA
jgi:uncharacterized protein YndB with AHSA1/START domain